MLKVGPLLQVSFAGLDPSPQDNTHSHEPLITEGLDAGVGSGEQQMCDSCPTLPEFGSLEATPII
jgi:hypothetical protein